jgi:hypothetical protein
MYRVPVRLEYLFKYILLNLIQFYCRFIFGSVRTVVKGPGDQQWPAVMDVNVHVEEAASVRKLRGPRELRGLFASFVVYVSCVR